MHPSINHSGDVSAEALLLMSLIAKKVNRREKKIANLLLLGAIMRVHKKALSLQMGGRGKGLQREEREQNLSIC